jgi:hypothetical protein
MSGQVYVVNGVECHPIVDKCEGCDRAKEHEGVRYCSTYPLPERKWAQKVCNFATHVKAEKDTGGKVKINPLKASKRAARGR